MVLMALRDGGGKPPPYGIEFIHRVGATLVVALSGGGQSLLLRSFLP